ncbi:MAG: TIGR02453 family protein [Cryomorphaceae bacterium]|nr:TIGR02453 family protein [Cryomorphaceae bacterium]
MNYFTQNSIDFFNELEKNNSKEWFDENRKRFETSIRKPMLNLVEDVIKEMKKHDSEFDQDAKKCLGRINRDIRFSDDKTPYNTHFFANISKGTKENPIAGIAFRIGGQDFGIMSGYYQPSKEKHADIREKIIDNLPEFQLLKSDKAFVEKFDTIQGVAYKRIPPELQYTFEKEVLIANKQFYYVAEKDKKFVLSENLKEHIIPYWLAAKPLNDFFDLCLDGNRGNTRPYQNSSIRKASVL